MAPYSNILAWKTPWAEEPGGWQSTRPQRVAHDWTTDHTHTHTHRTVTQADAWINSASLNSTEVFKKLKIEQPYDLAIPLLSMYLEKRKTLIWRETCTPVFIAALLTIAMTWKQHKYPSTEEWRNKMWHLYTMEGYSSVKKNEICHFQQHGWTQRWSY